MGIHIEQVWDEDLILSVLKEPRIWETISDDGQSSDKFVVDVEAEDYYFLAVVRENICVGIYVLHKFNDCTLEIHANILPQYRKECATESGEKVLHWFDKNVPDKYQKLVARIPEVYPEVYHFTLNRGFNDEGQLIAHHHRDRLSPPLVERLILHLATAKSLGQDLPEIQRMLALALLARVRRLMRLGDQKLHHPFERMDLIDLVRQQKLVVTLQSLGFLRPAKYLLLHRSDQLERR